MGISKSCFSLLCHLKDKVALGSTILQLGNQSIMFNYKVFKNISKKYGLSRPINNPKSSWENIYRNIPSNVEVFKALGFTKILSMDISKYEDSNIIHDLNEPVPTELWNSQDCIFDGGTSEHIFNTMMVLENIHNMLKIGGIAIHYTPANNHVDHGFFQFSPSFYYDYYRANNYEIIESYLVQSFRSVNRDNNIFQYNSLAFESLSFGGWRNYMLGCWFVVKKQENSTSRLNPQQSRYQELFWNERLDPAHSKNTLRQKLILYLNKAPILRYYLIHLRIKLRSLWFVYIPPKLPKRLMKL